MDTENTLLQIRISQATKAEPRVRFVGEHFNNVLPLSDRERRIHI